jgi:hypothetical protein
MLGEGGVCLQRSFIRNILMYAFHVLVYLLGVRTVKDTQCGFKMCTRGAARLIFPAMHVEVRRDTRERQGATCAMCVLACACGCACACVCVCQRIRRG